MESLFEEKKDYFKKFCLVNNALSKQKIFTIADDISPPFGNKKGVVQQVLHQRRWKKVWRLFNVLKEFFEWQDLWMCVWKLGGVLNQFKMPVASFDLVNMKNTGSADFKQSSDRGPLWSIWTQLTSTRILLLPEFRAQQNLCCSQELNNFNSWS